MENPKYMQHFWTVEMKDAGIRLDVFLTRQLPEITRSQLAKRIKSGEVTVNGKVATVHRFLKTGDAVVMHTKSRVVSTPAHEAHPLHAVHITIVSETSDWLVLDKPAGLLVHAVSDRDTGRDVQTLIDFLIAHHPKIAKVGDDPSRPGIVHRLDKEASGLMVIAKTQDAFDDLKRQFKEHAVDKRYLALVHGEMKQDEGDIKFRIARSKTQQRMAARPTHEEEGRAAWTQYKVLRRFRGATLLALTIFTGRTHQIRAHLFALNHPIVGDPLYKRRKEDRKISAPRLMLQAVHLGFTDPKTGEKKKFDLSPIPEFDTLV